jgi:hypothetical protein
MEINHPFIKLFNTTDHQTLVKLCFAGSMHVSGALVTVGDVCMYICCHGGSVSDSDCRRGTLVEKM